LDTKRDFLNFPYAIRPNFAAKHTASVVLKKFVTKLKTQFNGAYNFSSGRPYYNIVYDGSQYKFSDKGTIPDYHNFSFSINFLPSIGKKMQKHLQYMCYRLAIFLTFVRFMAINIRTMDTESRKSHLHPECLFT
jgi:hypothetical protein